MPEPDVSQLLTVAQAIEIIDREPVEPRIIDVTLSEADGHVLAEDIRADRDYPPFDKSQMDGFAVRCADAAAAPIELEVAGEIPAGRWPQAALLAGQTMAIMTGAPLPAGADGVVPIEETQRISASRVRILHPATPGKFIARKGSDLLAGAVVLEKGQLLGPQQLAAAASVGAARVNVYAMPIVAILATGDELVQIDEPPQPAQIRNTNNLMLVSLLKRLGCQTRDLGIVRDDPALIRRAIEQGLQSDILMITGGMSMGEYDYVPRILTEIGAKLKITKLRIKPGKPFVFGICFSPSPLACPERSRREGEGGVRGNPDLPHASVPMSSPSPLAGPERSRREGEGGVRGNPEQPGAPIRAQPTYIFGLPGNPLAGYVCVLRLASRLLARLAGRAPIEHWRTASLLQPLDKNGPREFYQPALLTDDGVMPLAWKGSADLYTLAKASALLVRPENDPPRSVGETVTVLEIPR